MGAEGLYKETYDNMFNREGINMEKGATYKINHIDTMLKKNIKIESKDMFNPVREQIGKASSCDLIH